ncbi:MAG: radical SAM/SPASM domain-containing protein [Putridiphycobacter sp.]|nr:radical SAM/SPASM domain-containing protein [Putridiphycobacter sp.]
MTKKNLALLKTLSVYRLWNFILLKLSYQISIITKRPIHWGYPIAISIEPTTACNLKCPECPSGLRQFTRPTGNLKPDVNNQILQSLGKHLQYINYYFQGEPFINPQFLDFVKAARQENIYVLTSTNAHFISEKTADEVVASGLSELIVSIDGTTQETYENYRIEGKLDQVLSGLTAIKKAKEKAKSQFPIVTIQFLVTAQNEHQIPEVKTWVQQYGADNLNLKTIQVYDYENGNRLLPKNEKYSRYKQDDKGKFKLKNKMSNYCWRMWTTCVFTWDGSIVPCCFDKDAKYKMGNITKAEFKQIWKDGLYTDFRQKILKQRADIDICKNCSEGSKIWV